MNIESLISLLSDLDLPLVFVTGIYVLLTYKLLRESKRANDLNRDAIEKQFGVLTLPHLYCDISKVKNKLTLTIYNIGNVPAYDVDILAIGLYDEEEVDIPTFMVKYVKPTFRTYPLQSNKEGFYGVYDHIVYAVFPFRKKVSVILSFPIRPEDVYILLQYRCGFLGTNYSQIYWFYESFEGREKGTYKLGSLDPKVITPSYRVSYDTNLVLKTEEGQSLPEHIRKHFLDIWNHSIPCGYIDMPFEGAEDRGKWCNI